MSEQSNLTAALLAFNSEGVTTLATTKKARVPTKKKDGTPGPTYEYDYLDMSGLLENVLPRLNGLGLLWHAMPAYTGEGKPVLNWRMTHVASGESEAGQFPLILEGAGAQAFGSAVTYARRYALVAYLGLATEKDDDAQAAQRAVSTGRGTAPRKVTEKRAKEIVDVVATAGKLDKLQLLASTIRGDNVGDCSTPETATSAIRKLTAEQADRVWARVSKEASDA